MSINNKAEQDLFGFVVVKLLVVMNCQTQSLF
jgi:hypothetical protein